jgi:DNA-binding transcriptional MocR family regulator
MRHFFLDGGGTHEVRLACSALDHPVIDEGIARLAAFIQAVVASG